MPSDVGTPLAVWVPGSTVGWWQQHEEHFIIQPLEVAWATYSMHWVEGYF